MDAYLNFLAIIIEIVVSVLESVAVIHQMRKYIQFSMQLYLQSFGSKT